jgi:hypothetical protein
MPQNVCHPECHKLEPRPNRRGMPQLNVLHVDYRLCDTVAILFPDDTSFSGGNALFLFVAVAFYSCLACCQASLVPRP